MLVALSPEEWLARLGKELAARWPQLQRWQRYYRGNHDLPAGPSQHQEAFLRFQRFARTNLCGLAVDSMVDRLFVEGVNTGSKSLDTQVWAWWQSARLDARQLAVYRKALSESAAYVFWAPGVKPGTIRLTIEGPTNAITEQDAADPTTTLAGLRAWFDPVTKYWLATIYIPGFRVYYQQAEPSLNGQHNQVDMFDSRRWVRRPAARDGGSVDATPESPDQPSVRAFLNADELSVPVAEFDVGMDVQDRLNLTVLNRLTAERYAAFRQRWATNLTLEDDPVTGLPMSPFKPGVTQVWTVEPPEPGEPETKFGDFAQTPTQDMLSGAEADMRAFAALTRTPVYYLPGDLINIGADAIAALDAGHNSKIRQKQGTWGEDWEAVLQGVAPLAGVREDLSDAEMIWRRPETYSPAVLGAYGLQLKGIGYPATVIAERIGDSPQQIEQLRAELATQAAMNAFLAPPPNQPPPNPNAPATRSPSADAAPGERPV